MKSNPKEFIWTQKYRPQTLNECILPKNIKKTFKEFLKQGEIQNLLLSGPPGIGKTTIARILCEQMKCDYIIINGSLEGRNIDTLRTTIYGFASTVSLQQSKFKVIIIDEADFLNAQSVQPALRAFMEEFSKNCRFIFITNYKNKLLEPIRSRCTEILFNIPVDEKQKVAIQFLNRIKNILKDQHITCDEILLSKIILKEFPDFRKIINNLQKYTIDGKIDTEILNNNTKIDELIPFLLKHDFVNVRKWVSENIDYDQNIILRLVYDKLYDIMLKSDIPDAVLIINKYMYQSSFVVDQEINLIACFVELMVLL